MDDEPTHLEESLDSLKNEDRRADTTNVTGDGLTRMDWSSVTDSGEPPADAPDEPDAPEPPSGFQFDLGGALERMGQTPERPATPLPADPSSDAPSPPPIPSREPAPPTVPVLQPQPGAPAPPAGAPPVAPAATAAPPAAPAAPAATPASVPPPPAAPPPSVEPLAAPPAPVASAEPASIAPSTLPRRERSSSRRIEPAPPETPMATESLPRRGASAPESAPPSQQPVVATPPSQQPVVATPPVRQPVEAALPVQPQPVQQQTAQSQPPMQPVQQQPVQQPPMQPVQPQPVQQPPMQPVQQPVLPAVQQQPQMQPVQQPPQTTPAMPEQHGAKSVFDGGAPAPSLPTHPIAPPASPALPPSIPPSVAEGLPSLPASNPVVAPIVVPDNEPVGPDLHAVRSFQLHAQREQRGSRVFGRTFLAVLLLAALVGSALVFGRSLLFPQEWNAELTPHVDRIQNTTALEFTDVVDLEVLPDAEYADIALVATVGDDWANRLAEWRALGIASGESSSDDITRAVVALRPAVYDSVTNMIYRAEGADADALVTSYEAALYEVFLRQQATPPNTNIEGERPVVLGTSSAQRISSQSLDRALSGSDIGAVDVSADLDAPLPLVYEFAAIDRLGSALANSFADVDLSYGDVYPDEVLTATAPTSPLAPAGAAADTGEPLADRRALGNDAWSLVWANRLPAATVDRLSSQIVADSYQPVERERGLCVVATFRTASEANTAGVLAALSTWAGSAPAEADVVVGTAAPNIVELSTCDPSAGIQQAVDATAVTDAIGRQISRLAP